DTVQADDAALRAVGTGDAVHALDACLQLIDLLGRDEVGLVEQDDVGEGDLLQHLAGVLEVPADVVRIDDGDDGVEAELVLHLLIDEERLRHWAGVGHAGRLDQDVVELVSAFHEVAEDADEVAADLAAQAAVVGLEQLLLGADDEVAIDADLAELVLDDGDALAVLGGDEVVERGGGAGADEAGQHGDGDAGVGMGGYGKLRVRGKKGSLMSDDTASGGKEVGEGLASSGRVRAARSGDVNL